MTLIQVHNEPGLVRDEESSVILNTNIAEYQLILEKRRHKNDIKKVTDEVENLKSEMDELKKLIKAAAK